MKHHAIQFSRDSAGEIVTFLIFILLIATFISCASGTVDGGPAASQNPCLNGFFSDEEVSVIVVHNAGSVTMTGWKEPGHVVPWETFSYSGLVQSGGSAIGEFTLHFPAEAITPTEIEIPQTTVPDVRVRLSDGGSCETRNIMSFSFVYETPDTTTRDDLTGRALTRRP
jgi:hypothetical protein